VTKGNADLIASYTHARIDLSISHEHPFHIVKDLFHCRKVRYKGLDKNTAQLHTLFALASL
jgi:IS5 family transposase